MANDKPVKDKLKQKVKSEVKILLDNVNSNDTRALLLYLYEYTMYLEARIRALEVNK